MGNCNCNNNQSRIDDLVCEFGVEVDNWDCSCYNGSDTYAELVLEVKQGEARPFGFTIEKDDQPFDLTGWTINFMVKKAPYAKLSSIISKTITETYSSDGHIYSPLTGEFEAFITEEDTTELPPYDYSLVIEMTDGEQILNISGNCNTRSVFRICCQ